MPIYEWEDKNTGKVVEVYRDTFDDYKIPPTDEEAAGAGLSKEEAKNADYRKLISKGIKVVHAEGYIPGGKGVN